MAPEEAVAVQLSVVDLHLILEGLDAYEYWQLGHVLPRNNGMVFLPDDPFAERYWPAEEAHSDVQLEAIEAVRDCRELAERLTRALSIDD